MSDEEKLTEASLVIKLPLRLKKELESLTYLDIKGDKIRIYVVTDIAREALLKGVRLIILEREILNRMLEKEAKNEAERIYTSLIISAEKAGETAVDSGEAPAQINGGKNMEEEYEEPEDVEEPDTAGEE